jgi:uncharacterized phage protein (TIGR01671 family)
MRELKFRAWDKNLNRWLNENEYQEIRINPIQDRYGNGFNLNDSNFPYISSSIRVDIVFMQFTGLKDKNGKEIYEGDICKFSDWKPKAIEWKDGRFRLGNTLVICCEMECSGMEIIGNIYENPELLEEK